jgi:hypothetical protein
MPLALSLRVSTPESYGIRRIRCLDENELRLGMTASVV